MRILVTGGAGYIGSHTVKLLLARGHDVRVLDNLVYGHRAAVPADRLTVADLADAPAVDQLLLSHRTEAVVHFAAFASVGESVKHPAKYWQNNVVNTLTLLDLCRRHGVKRFVFSSTAATYGAFRLLELTEEPSPSAQHDGDDRDDQLVEGVSGKGLGQHIASSEDIDVLVGRGLRRGHDRADVLRREGDS
jgi:UDP-glucose 4-epimerase